MREKGNERYIKGLSAFTVSSASEILRILKVRTHLSLSVLYAMSVTEQSN